VERTKKFSEAEEEKGWDFAYNGREPCVFFFEKRKKGFGCREGGRFADTLPNFRACIRGVPVRTTTQ